MRIFNVAGDRDPDPTRIVPRALAAAVGLSESPKVNGEGSATLEVHGAKRCRPLSCDTELQHYYREHPTEQSVDVAGGWS